MDGRGAKLVPTDQFTEALRARREDIAALEDRAISSLGDTHVEVAESVWSLIESLGISESEAKLVGCTKALHHLLPDLIIPMDRAWTRRFFAWHVPEFQYQEHKVFFHAFEQFGRIAREVRPERLVGTGWRTCPAKVLDNALVGCCMVENLPLPS
jgi:hypothetical protein